MIKVSIKKMKKEELELMSYKDITYLLIEEDGKQTTVDLFSAIVKMLELSQSEFETKIGDYYTSLTTDKRFILLDDGMWDLRTKHPKKNIVIDDELDELDEIELEDVTDDNEEEATSDNYDEDDEVVEDDEEYKDLIIVDEEELGLEE